MSLDTSEQNAFSLVPSVGPDVEAFAVFASRESFQKVFLVVTLLPWTNPLPVGVLAPEVQSPDFLIDEKELAQAIVGVNTVLIPASFEAEEEQEQAKRILPQFSRFENVCVIMVQLLPPGMQLSPETNDMLLKRYDEMLVAGADDVIFEPEQDVGSLKRAVSTSRAIWEMSVARAQLMANAELNTELVQEAGKLQEESKSLFWEEIPQIMMPHFRTVDTGLLETGYSVGQFRLISKLPAVKGCVLQAVDDDHRSVAIKVLEKVAVDDPGKLETVYREYRILSEIIRHPNIARCVDMLHSENRVYLIMEFAGSENVEHLLRGRTVQRMTESEVNNTFEQVVRGVAHLHSKDIAHRNICLQHLVLSYLAGSDREHIRIIDFQTCMVSKPNSTSSTVCGQMPYMAPEMALGGPYYPHSIDTWSCGVVLLEMAGGLGSLSRSVPFDPDASPASIAPLLLQYFEDPVSHTEALATLAAVDTIAVIEQLEQLLVPHRLERILLRNLLPENQPGAEQELLAHEQQRLQEQQQQQMQMQLQMQLQMQANQAAAGPPQQPD